MRRARDKEADGTAPEIVRAGAGKELANERHVACDGAGDPEAMTAAPGTLGASGWGGARRKPSTEGGQAGVLPLLNANGEIGAQRLKSRGCAKMTQNDSARDDGETGSHVPISINEAEELRALRRGEDDNHPARIDQQTKMLHHPCGCLLEFLFGEAAGDQREDSRTPYYAARWS